jgi:DNA-binding GntR family transcriptional regulator
MEPTTRPLTTRLKPVGRERLADLAHAAIRESIISGAFPMGERLVETHLARELAISRAPIREALQRLAKEGLITEHPHQGAFVIRITPTDVVDLYNVRLGLETIAIRLFMKRGAPTRRLWAKIAAMTRAAERDDIAGVVKAEFEFHRIICDMAENALLSQLFAQQEGRLLMMLALDDASFEHLHDIAAEHEPLVRAIEIGDPGGAVHAMEEHLLSTVGELLDRLGGDRSMLLAPLMRSTENHRSRENF